MTARLAAAALLVVALLAALLLRGASGSAPSVPTSAGRPARSVVAPSASPSPQRLVRDPFRFADERPPVHDLAPPTIRPAPTPLVTTLAAAPAVRLDGFARQSGVLKAVLNLLGSVAVVGPGETVDGYRVISVDEERGVRLLQPDGTEITLPPLDRE